MRHLHALRLRLIEGLLLQSWTLRNQKLFDRLPMLESLEL